MESIQSIYEEDFKEIVARLTRLDPEHKTIAVETRSPGDPLRTIVYKWLDTERFRTSTWRNDIDRTTVGYEYNLGDEYNLGFPEPECLGKDHELTIFTTEALLFYEKSTDQADSLVRLKCLH